MSGSESVTLTVRVEQALRLAHAVEAQQRAVQHAALVLDALVCGTDVATGHELVNIDTATGVLTFRAPDAVTDAG